jgi:hypothetical protein
MRIKSLRGHEDFPRYCLKNVFKSFTDMSQIIASFFQTYLGPPAFAEAKVEKIALELYEQFQFNVFVSQLKNHREKRAPDALRSPFEWRLIRKLSHIT